MLKDKEYRHIMGDTPKVYVSPLLKRNAIHYLIDNACFFLIHTKELKQNGLYYLDIVADCINVL